MTRQGQTFSQDGKGLMRTHGRPARNMVVHMGAILILCVACYFLFVFVFFTLKQLDEILMK